MKFRVALLGSFLLAACNTTAYSPDAKALLQNPLFAELYSEQLVDTMVNLEIYEDPVLQDEAKKKVASDAKEQWLAVARKARADQREGLIGQFVPMKEYAEGEVLYKDDMLHFSPPFITTPGPDLHVWISTVVDPRDAEFPDPTAIDVGPMHVPYGAQTMPVPAVEDPKAYRSVVLWDNALGRLWGFAQISPMFE